MLKISEKKPFELLLVLDLFILLNLSRPNNFNTYFECSNPAEKQTDALI